MKLRVPFFVPLLSAGLAAHPMGNFSVNHYARIEAARTAPTVRYVLDLAEIPSFELLQKWNLNAASPRADWKNKATEQARAWVGKALISRERTVRGTALRQGRG